MRTTTIPFTAGDGLQCNLLHVETGRAPSRGPVLLVHGAGVRANIFRAPVEKNLVDCLLDAGYDVWLENWRASIDLPRNEWSLDQAALYDHPYAVRKVVELTGARSIQAIIHCQGSTSFMMSAVAGLVPQVSTIISNAVSLHTVVPDNAKKKISIATPVIGLFTRFLDAQWGMHSPGILPKLLTRFVDMTHKDCSNKVCKYSSFIYGASDPTLWNHSNLNDETHEWVKQEFAHCPVSFFRQMKRCVSSGHLVSNSQYVELPEDFIETPPETDARIAFFAGSENRCFLPESQIRTFNYFNAYRPAYHSLHVIDGYGHLDVFMGQNAATDIFPRMLDELE